jgi:very-short-patch-repair endonuclease
MTALGIKFEREVRFSPPRRWRFDFVIHEGESALWAVEIEGGAWNGGHRRGAETDKDCEKHNAAQILGWRVLRFTPNQVETGESIETIAAALGREI